MSLFQLLDQQDSLAFIHYSDSLLMHAISVQWDSNQGCFEPVYFLVFNIVLCLVTGIYVSDRCPVEIGDRQEKPSPKEQPLRYQYSEWQSAF